MKISGSSHVLTTLGILFLLGGVLRMMPSASADQDERPGPDQIAPPSLPAQLSDETQASASCEAGLRDILSADFDAYQTSQEQLRIETLRLQVRQQELETLEQELEALRLVLNAQWDQLRNTADQDVSHLAAMYGAMKAADAALIFDQMDASFAAGFLRELPGEAAGQILAEMEPGKAYRISIALAARGSDVRNATAP